MDFLGKLANDAIKSNNQQAPNAPPPQQQHQPQSQSGGTDALLGKLGGLVGGNNNAPQHQQQAQTTSSSGGLLDKLHGLAGGGPQSEKKEDALDKGIDWVQENVLKQGAQHNESATEQAKDKFIADTIRDQYKKTTGNEFPVKAKEEEKKKSGFGGFGGFGL